LKLPALSVQAAITTRAEIFFALNNILSPFRVYLFVYCLLNLLCVTWTDLSGKTKTDTKKIK